MRNHQKQICQKSWKLSGLPERAGGSLFDVHGSHSLGEALLKSGLDAAAFLGRRGLSRAIKSDYARKTIKNVAKC